MDEKQNFIKNIFIHHSFFWWILLVALVPLIVMSYFSIQIAETSLRKEVLTNLSTIADNKKNNIESYIQKSKMDAALLAKNPFILDATIEIETALKKGDLNNPTYLKAIQKLRTYANGLKMQAGYTDIMLLSSSGQFLFSLTEPGLIGRNDTVGPYKDSTLMKTFNNAATLLETQISDFENVSTQPYLQAYIAVPIYNQGSLIGILILEISNQAIAKVVNDTAGLGKTGETLIGKMKGNHIIPEVPLRFSSISDFMNNPIALDQKMLDSFRKASRGGKGEGFFIDYRNKQVIGVWRYLPSQGWGMLVKIDDNEAFSPVEILKHNVIILCIFSFIFAISTAYLVGTRLQRSENELTATLAKLQTARDQALEADRTKSNFLANMSHELRTPLNAIIGYSEMLQEEARDMELESFIQDLNRINGAGKHLLGLINDILDISKIESGKMQIYLEEANMQTILEDVINIATPLINSKNNKLEIKYNGNISLIYTDVTKLRQCLFNLLSNASKFTSDGIITLSIKRVIKDGVKYIQFSVSDTGIGMTPEQLTRLFKAFSQADASTTRKYGGTGLGLFITQTFCKMLKGDISVTSEANKGTTFTIILPDIRAPEPEIITEEKTQIKPGNLLIIDDDAHIYNFIKESLVQTGYELQHATNSEEGLALARQYLPQVIILDVIMPGTDGWAMLGILKSDPELRQIPVIMLTVLADKDTGYALGATEFLIKPVQANLLIETLERYLSLDQPANILAVEDDELARTLIIRALSKTPWKITECVNGFDALDKLQHTIPQAILLDLMMPGMDGFEVIKAIRNNEKWRSIPVIVITAKDLTAEDKERLNGGVALIIRKGAYKKEELLTIIQQTIEKGKS